MVIKRMICLVLSLMLVISSIPGVAFEADETIVEELIKEEIVVEAPLQADHTTEDTATEDTVSGASIETDGGEDEIASDLVEAPVDEVVFELGGEEEYENDDEIKEEEINFDLIEEALYAAKSASDFVIENGVLTEYLGTNSIVVIPDGVTTISTWAFLNNSSINNVIISQSVTKIESWAFSNCKNLTTVDIPKSVTAIANDSFVDCPQLNLVVEVGSYAEEYCRKTGLSYTVTTGNGSIINNGQCGDHVFWDLNADKTLIIRGTGAMWNYDENRSDKENPWYRYSEYNCGQQLIEKVIIENGVTSIGDYAFAECDANEIIIPDSVTAIGKSAMSACFNLKYIVLPDGITTIKEDTFSESGIEDIKWPKQLETIESFAFGMSGIKKAHFPNGLKSIGDYAFFDTSLEVIDIPASVDQIENAAFRQCDSIKTIQVSNANATYISENNALYLREMDFLVRCATAEKGTFVVPSSVQYIGTYAFDMSHYSSIVLPEGLKAIGDSAFSGCFNLQSINIPASVVSISDSAFILWGNDGTQFDNEKMSITVVPGSYGEQYCKEQGLSYVVTSSEAPTMQGILRQGDGWQLLWNITGGTFTNGIMTNATLSLSVSGSNATFGTIMTYNDSGEDNNPWLDDAHGITKASFAHLDISGTESNPIYLITEMFNGYSSVVDARMSCVEQIGSYAFAECKNLISVNGFDKYLRVIESGAFKNCSALTDITYERNGIIITPTKLTSIGGEAFKNTALENITLHPSVTSIGANAFDGCPYLTIFCSRNTTAHIYATQNSIPYRFMPFYMPHDSWQFSNGGDAFGKNDNRYYLNAKDREKFLSAFSSRTDREEVRELLDTADYIGACVGMSSICVLNKWGVISPSDIQKGAAYLHDITKTNNDDVESFITYFHLQQILPEFGNAEAAFRAKSVKDRIEKICELAENANKGDGPFYLGIRIGDKGHFVVGYGISSGSYTYKNKNYTHKISIYDCAYPDTESALYCNRGRTDFAMEHWSVDELKFASTNPKEFAPLLYGVENTRLLSHILYSGATGELSINVDGKNVIIGNGTYDQGKGIIVTSFSGGSSDLRMVTFLNGDTDFSVKTSGSVDFLYNSENGLYNIEAGSAEEVTFTKDGAMSMSDVSGSYEVALIVDDPSTSTPWTETRVGGKDSDIAINPTKEGLIISGENLQDVTVVASNDKGETEIKLDTDQTSVLVTGENSAGNKPAPTVYEDENGDGVYETLVSGGTESIQLTSSSAKKTINVGQELQITLPDYSITTCKSSKTKVATVTKAGLIKAVSAGSAKITVTMSNKKKRTLSLTVVDPYLPTGVSFKEGKSTTLSMGDTLKLNAVLSPATAQSNLTWKSSKTKVATVDDNGVVTPKAEGTAKITVTTRNKKTASISIQVVDPYKPTSVSFAEGKTATVNMGETLKLNVILTPSTSKTTMTWKSSKTKVASVDADGVVTPKAEGKTTITLTTSNKKKATINVTVLDPYKPSKVSLDYSGTVKIGVGQTLQLNAILYPETAKTTLTWTSSSKKIATVSGTGLVTGLKNGKSTITVKTSNGKKATVKITVDKNIVPTDDWLSNFESGKSGIKVYCSNAGAYFHAKTGCSRASGTQSLVTLETALNYGKEPCTECMTSAAVKVYVTKDDHYYHSTINHAKKGAIETNVAKARAYGLDPCPQCVSGTDVTIDENSDPESIRFVQEMLVGLGLLTTDSINGVYGTATRDAVKRFQERVNQLSGYEVLEVTGTLDPLSLSFLEYYYDEWNKLKAS